MSELTKGVIYVTILALLLFNIHCLYYYEERVHVIAQKVLELQFNLLPGSCARFESWRADQHSARSRCRDNGDSDWLSDGDFKRHDRSWCEPVECARASASDTYV